MRKIKTVKILLGCSKVFFNIFLTRCSKKMSQWWTSGICTYLLSYHNTTNETHTNNYLIPLLFGKYKFFLIPDYKQALPQVTIDSYLIICFHVISWGLGLQRQLGIILNSPIVMEVNAFFRIMKYFWLHGTDGVNLWSPCQVDNFAITNQLEHLTMVKECLLFTNSRMFLLCYHSIIKIKWMEELHLQTNTWTQSLDHPLKMKF